MRAILTIGSVIALSGLAVVLLFVPVAAASEQPMGTEGTSRFDTQPMNLETQSSSSRDIRRAEGEVGKGQEIPMRVPEGEGGHLLAPASKHFLFMGDPSVNAELLEQLRIQDEISSYAF
ncbi:MAG: hypothetical protein KGO52_15210 [Nitrospirota bacterium]|nr:hypothetical protein [Nitrospirota bacterium]MDE3244058.1 hypothetical protein [Nitrospirota bacterium]